MASTAGSWTPWRADWEPSATSFPRRAAVNAFNRIVEVMAQTQGFQQLSALASGLRALVDKLPPQAAANAADRIVEVMAQTRRMALYSTANSLVQTIEYNRSRMRISRGWALNSLLLLIAWNLYGWLRLPADPQGVLLLMVGNAVGWTLIAGSFFSWRLLCKAQYEKVRWQAEFLAEQQASRPEDGLF